VPFDGKRAETHWWKERFGRGFRLTEMIVDNTLHVIFKDAQ